MTQREPKQYSCSGCGNEMTILGGNTDCPRCGLSMKLAEGVKRPVFRESAIQRDFNLMMDEIEGYLAALEEG